VVSGNIDPKENPPSKTCILAKDIGILITEKITSTNMK
jgi:hypothetical protein